jgi:hypothetical protein
MVSGMLTPPATPTLLPTKLGGASVQELVEAQAYPLNSRELEWLTSLSAAIAAGLFNEWDLEAVGPDLIATAASSGTSRAPCSQWDTQNQCKSRVLQVTVANLGSTASGPTVVRVEGSNQCSTCAQSLQLPSLIAGTQTTRYTTVVVPLSCRSISLFVDPANAIAELVENNNSSAVLVC